ncbi:hypothetical protein [Oceanospirillum beijerinckii]|uniref:hypothetical protein n=1 Tax=Oceanospirillum beijerinckii TaxID=64976 RepID=UPI0003F82053|nr:hypothetical protein [Oceanospirillum beijerinckii]
MEEPKRLPPKTDTLRRLYTVSGNQCSFPGCIKPMFNNEGNFVGQICHISAAMPKGERFDPNMTNEQRRSFDNLMLMCYEHHIETNKEEVYSIEKLKAFKDDHEKRFTNIENMVSLMQESIVDVTSNVKANRIENLQKINVNDSGVYYKEPFHEEDIKAFNSMIKVFESLSPQARKTFAISLSRSKYEKNYSGFDSDRIYFDPNEIERVTDNCLRSIFDELEGSELIYLDEVHIGNDREVYRYRIHFKDSEVNFWDSINKYCKYNNLDVVDIVTFMKFTVFDQ